MNKQVYSLCGVLFVAILAPAALARHMCVQGTLTLNDETSLKAAFEEQRHRIVVTSGGFETHRPSEQWTTRFDGRGSTTTPDAGGWTWGLELAAFGWGGELSTIDQAADVTSSEHRVEYVWDAHLTEWYVNDARGLEHGFTVHSRPAGTVGALSLELDVRGELTARTSTSGRDVVFGDSTGGEVLNYAGLVVHDAMGAALQAQWSVRGEHLVLEVVDGAATYPLTIDPVVQLAYLKAPNTNTGDEFGYSVALSGDTAVIGARSEDSGATGVGGNQANNGTGNSGAVYVFVRRGAGWTFEAYLKASNTDANDWFGYDVAVSGDTIVVGAPFESSNASGVNGDETNDATSEAGAAYVFVRSGSTWTQEAYLKSSDPGVSDRFGSDVAIFGDTVAVGAFYEDSNAVGVNGNAANNSSNNSGCVFVFARSGATWAQEAYLKASNTGASDQFGSAVAAFGDTIVVGAPFEDCSAVGVNSSENNNFATAAGAAYVFVRGAGGWSQQAYLKASNTAALDQFGWSVAGDGETLVIGANGESSTATASGAAYVFTRSGSTWSQESYLKASNSAANDQFGVAVGVSGNALLVGASGEDSNAVGVDGNQLSNSASGSGAVYLFTRSGSVWSQSAYLKASNTNAGDGFGAVLAISSTGALIGASGEDSNAVVINGNGGNNAAPGAGAAYFFDLESWATLSGCFGNPASLTTASAGLQLGASSTLDFAASLYPTSLAFLYYGAAGVDLAGCGTPVSGVGEVLMALSPFPTQLTFQPTSAGSAQFVVGVPMASQLVGVEVTFQVVNVDLVGGLGAIELSNAIVDTIAF